MICVNLLSQIKDLSAESRHRRIPTNHYFKTACRGDLHSAQKRQTPLTSDCKRGNLTVKASLTVGGGSVTRFVIPDILV